MNQEYKLYRISQLLSRFREQVKILNANGEFNINIHAENILINILNEVYDCKLENVNYIKNKVYPSIDLRDKFNRIAVQVTSVANLEKVKYTLLKFIENNLHNEFDRIYIFIITEKQSKYDQSKVDDVLGGKFVFQVKNIIDRTDIYRELNSQNNIKKINSVGKLLEGQFADESKLNKWDLYCKGLNEYDLYINKLYNYLDIKGFSPKINNTLVKISLEKIYVPLELKVESDNSEKSDNFRSPSEMMIYSIEEALCDFNKLVILGDPGSGKSTILKYLIYNICSKRETNSQFSELVPILIKGSEYAKYVSSNSKSLAEYIIDYVDKKYENLFVEKLEQRQLLVLIDGIDEINKIKLRHDVINRINSFIAQYPEIKIIVSSRVVGYKETRLSGYFNHLNIIQFTESQIKQFAINWYLSIETRSDNDYENAKLKANELLASIRQNQSVLKMASNPLLVTIIALIHYQGSTLPEKRASLYDVATSTFLENWVRQREGYKHSNFDKETIQEMLAPIAFHIHVNYTTGLIVETELRALLLNEYKKIHPYLTPKETKKDINEIIEFLREDAGFLFEKGINENGEPMFGFVHQTFQEYFTAIEFKTRWKEGELKEGLDYYVFNSSWKEVIILAASLFKLNDQTRIGRQYATGFVRDILNVKDPYPEIYRPLVLVSKILMDGADIEFSLFIEIVNVIFDKILGDNEILNIQSNSYNREVSSFKIILSQLLDTKTYQSYLVERITKEIQSKASNVNLAENLFYVIVFKSNIAAFKKFLLKILRSKDEKLKSFIFRYNVILPVAEIVKTVEFRQEIIKYINSDFFALNYKGHLPAQYEVCFEINRFESLGQYLKRFSEDQFLDEIMKERMEAIRHIENENMKNDLVNFYVFRVGLGGVENIKLFVRYVKAEFSEVNLMKIERHIKTLEKLESYGLNKYEIVKINSFKIYAQNKDDFNFAFVRGKKVDLFKFPFNDKTLYPYFGEETKAICKLLNLVIPMLKKTEKQIVINDLPTLLCFIKYHNKLHWHLKLDTQNVLNYALRCLFDKKNNVNREILNWIKTMSGLEHNKGIVDKYFQSQEFKEKILTSKLEIYDKLYFIYLIGNKTDCECLILPTIKEQKATGSVERKKEINRILYLVLGH